MMQALIVVGTPYPWQTPERSRWTTYKNPKLATWQQLIVITARAQSPRRLEGAVSLSTRVYVPRPPSHLRKDGKLKKGKPALPISARTGDCTNHHKAIEDALKGIYWYDDSQVVEAYLYLRYADGRDPGAIITIESVEDPPF